MWEIESFAVVRAFIERGGNVLLVIAFVTAVLWTLIIERFWYFRTGHRREAKRIQSIWDARSDHKSWNARQIRRVLISEVELHLKWGLGLIGTLVALCPMLGLLGTVTGMIKTFQAITLFGAGDPRMMAGGISEALVTTMLGLTVAIPLVLLSDTLANSTRKVIDILDEKSAGLIAMRSEQSDVGD